MSHLETLQPKDPYTFPILSPQLGAPAVRWRENNKIYARFTKTKTGTNVANPTHESPRPMLNNMKNGTAPPPPTTTATYTTIPISGSDVISRSIYNISSFLSLRRPWTEVLASGVFDRPESLSAAAQRLRKNLAYFRLNYGIFLCACALLSLIGTPLYLILISAVFALWLIFYFFREDPLYLWGHSIRDRFVLAALICVTLVTFWFARVVESVVVGLGLGLVVLAFHGVFRNPEGLFMDEAEAASSGLIGRTV